MDPKEALELVLTIEYALLYHARPRIAWKDEAASRRAAERYGFSYEGLFRKHMIVKGHSRDTAWFSMLDSEWPARKASFERWLAPENFDRDGRQKKKLAAT